MIVCNEEVSDKELIGKFLEDKMYLAPIISDDFVPILSQQQNCQKLFDFIQSKRNYFQKQNANLEESYEKEKRKIPPKFITAKAKLIFREIRFLNFHIFDILIKINEYKEKNIMEILKGVKSLSRFALVFPFILKKIIVETQTLERVFSNYITKDIEKEIVQLTYESSQLRNKVGDLSKSLQVLTNMQIPEFNYSTSTYTNSAISFSIFTELLPNEIKKIINSLVDNIIESVQKIDNSPEMILYEISQTDRDGNQFFSDNFQKLVESICQFIGISSGKKPSQKISTFLLRHLFESVYERNQSPFPSKLIEKQANQSVFVSDFPIKDIIENVDENMLISDFVSSNETLSQAKNELEMLIFENCPTDILIRVNYVVKLVQKYNSDIIKKKEGSIPSFIPFDNVIQIFNAVFNASSIPGIASIVYTIMNYSPYNYLPNDLAFAHDTLISAYSLIN